jgi:sarcosine oxidase subunit gamma
MTDTTINRHGLESFLRDRPAGSNAVVTISILMGLGHINLRGNPGSSEFLSLANKILQQELPVVANTTSVNGEQRIYWLGPDEWLIVTPDDRVAALCRRLLDEMSLLSIAVNDLSGGQIVLRVSGAGAEKLLSKGCTLDLAAERFPVGSCAQSGLAKAAGLIARVDDAGSFYIVIRRSFSEYLMKWLHNAGQEFGIDIHAG